MTEYNVVGLMSGTSLDGLDIAHCRFWWEEGWNYKVETAETLHYTDEWQKVLSTIHKGSGTELAAAHAGYGKLLGASAAAFISKHGLRPDFISSHGHTIFHQPNAGYTFQLGDGAALAAESGLPVIADFRTADVALGGQGAPLVPIGDRLLFSEFDFCLNLGGIANISFEYEGKRIAFDSCVCNLALNRLARLGGKDYDAGGALAKSGTVNEKLLSQLESDEYLQKKFPKSLGREDLERTVFPLLDNSSLSVEDRMATVSEFIARQIAALANNGKMLVSGGGALNTFLLDRIRHHSKASIVVPETLLIEFKEALVFAFLGLLRWRNENNCLASVTGASRDHSGGAIFLP